MCNPLTHKKPQSEPLSLLVMDSLSQLSYDLLNELLEHDTMKGCEFVLKLTCTTFAECMPKKTRTKMSTVVKSVTLLQWAHEQGCPWNEDDRGHGPGREYRSVLRVGVRGVGRHVTFTRLWCGGWVAFFGITNPNPEERARWRGGSESQGLCRT
uniref:Uncharacterized protein n=1 Tax=viral metagenome TaxID=1070528 RepID=A0A6C0IY80_9ZZZZ